MNTNFKRTFFSSLLAVLFVISNLIGIKYTNFGNLILSVNFVVLPFVFLCILLINNLCNKKEAQTAVASAAFIQVFILLSYVLVTNLGSQNLIPDFANSVNVVFTVDEVYIIINLIAIMLVNYVLQYIYDYFMVIGYNLFGTFISVLSAIILYGFVTIPIINYSFGIDIILKIIMCHLLMSVIMSLLVTALYYLLKEDKYSYEEDKVFIKPVVVENEKKDKTIDEVIKITHKEPKKQARKKSSTKKTTKKTDNSKKNVKK